MANLVRVESEAELSKEERIECAKEAMALSTDLDKLEAEFKESRETWRKRIREVKTRFDDKKKAFEVGTETRELLCEANLDMKNKSVSFIHNGKIIKTRDLSETEIEKYGHTPLQGFEQDDSIESVMAEEKSAKKKKDHVSK